MLTLIADCPRCKATRTTFDVMGKNPINQRFGHVSWQHNLEIFSICRHCNNGTIFVVMLDNYAVLEAILRKEYWNNKNINDDFKIKTYISIKDFSSLSPPEDLPDKVKKAFVEGADCLSIQAYNAAAAMFRLSIDLATKDYLPTDESEGCPTRRQRRELAARLDWLFESHKIPADLRDLAACVREDGNDGVHDGSLDQHEAEDLADFAGALLTRIYTEPARIEHARQRREARRKVEQ